MITGEIDNNDLLHFSVPADYNFSHFQVNWKISLLEITLPLLSTSPNIITTYFYKQLATQPRFVRLRL